MGLCDRRCALVAWVTGVMLCTGLAGAQATRPVRIPSTRPAAISPVLTTRPATGPSDKFILNFKDARLNWKRVINDRKGPPLDPPGSPEP